MIPSLQKPGTSRENNQSSDQSEQQNWDNIKTDKDLDEFMDKSNDNDSQVLDSLAELEDFVLSQMRGQGKKQETKWQG